MVRFSQSFTAALYGHMYQTDKLGEPYIKHLLRVAGNVPTEYMHIAILHDFFEDVHPVHTEQEIRVILPFLSEADAYTLLLLTRREDETYDEYIDRLIRDDAARVVKMADLDDHLLTEEKIPDTLVERYRKALGRLAFYQEFGFDLA